MTKSGHHQNRQKKNSPEQPQSLPQQTKTVSAASFTGPIPPPNILSAYNEIEPGLANRIVSMAEEEAIHRRGIEKKVLNAQNLKRLVLNIFFV